MGRYRAVAYVREGRQLIGSAWHPRFVEVTIAICDTAEEADTEVRAFVARSGPRGIEWEKAFVRPF